MLTPADLADLLDCEHRSVLLQALAAGLPGAPRPAPAEPGPRRGHATAMLAGFRAGGREIAEIDVRDTMLAAKATEEALRAGVPVLHRAVFLDGEFSAQADFLV